MNKPTVDVVVIGAGPYGLSLAAHLRARGIAFRIFGRVMDSWMSHMPKGMMLKSDGFASNLYDPGNRFTLKQFCAERDIEYDDTNIPVRLDTFTSYGVAFQQQLVPELENKLVSDVSAVPEGFLVRLEDGETMVAARVVMAVGVTHFSHTPSALAGLPAEFVSHSSAHRELDAFRGREVAVIGGGASAVDIAGLLHQVGASVNLISRRERLKFNSKGSGQRSIWQEIRHPKSGLGPGLRARFVADAPLAFHYLPERFRLKAVRTMLGPASGWVAKEWVVGRVPMLLGHTILGAEVRDKRVHLHFRLQDGTERLLTAEHVIAATGYQPNVDRLTFLSNELRRRVRVVDQTPVLTSSFESTVPGLYFVGLAAANSFGPVQRFAFGARFASNRVTSGLLKSLSRMRETALAPPLALNLT